MPRLLDLFAPPGRPWDATGLRAFRSLVLLHAAVRTFFWYVPPDSLLAGAYVTPATVVLMRLGLVVAVVASLWRRAARAAVGAAAAAVLVQVSLSFPAVKDPLYLELFCLLSLTLLDVESDSDGPLLRSALCWMAVLVLFHSGLQKVLHGYYFFAELPLAAVADGQSFGELFGWMLPAGEMARLRGLNLSLPDAGPFRSDMALLLIVSNAIWALEIGLAVLVAVPRTRRFGALAAGVLVLVVHVVGGQPLYALLMTQLLLLCIPGQWSRRLAWVVAAAYLAVFLAAAGVGSSNPVLREGSL